MNDIRFVTKAPGKGDLYINGQQVPGVVKVEPDLFAQNSVATITVTLSVSRFTVEPGEMSDCGLKASDYA